MSRLRRKLERNLGTPRPAPRPAAAEPAPQRSSLRERLERIARGGRPRPQQRPPPTVLGRAIELTPWAGGLEVVLRLPLDEVFGGGPLRSVCAVGREAALLSGDPALIDFDPRSAIFLDTETTGLSRSAGCLAPVIGWARLEGEELLLRQLVMTDPGLEPVIMGRLMAAVDEAGALVSFNGKSFDVDLLATRLKLLGEDPGPLRALPHLDLLHPARRLFSASFGGASQKLLERRLLRIERGHDIPGAEVPPILLAFLRTGQQPPILPVLRHNLLDLMGLVQLTGALSRHLSEGPGLAPRQRFDLARLLLARKRPEEAARLLHEVAGEGTDPLVRHPALLWLGRIQKKAKAWDEALASWAALRALSGTADPEPWVEAAKVLEHRTKDLAAAEQLVARLLREAPRDDPDRPAWQQRHYRLKRKCAKAR